jgi:site-specific DNA-methyltransferase (adenine-specific)
MDRIIEISTDPGDVILDPFGGSGTTYVAAELKKRKWVGVEIGPVAGIAERLQNLDEERAYLSKIRKDYNLLFTHKGRNERQRRGLWTCDNVHHAKPEDAKQTRLPL